MNYDTSTKWEIKSCFKKRNLGQYELIWNDHNIKGVRIPSLVLNMLGCPFQ